MCKLWDIFIVHVYTHSVNRIIFDRISYVLTKPSTIIFISIDRLRIDVMKNGSGREGCHG